MTKQLSYNDFQLQLLTLIDAHSDLFQGAALQTLYDFAQNLRETEFPKKNEVV